MRVFTHQVLLPDSVAGAPPEWLHLVPAGTFKGKDGRGPFKLLNAAAVITASMKEGKLALDENHSTDLAAPNGEPSPARGWIVEMQSREDGIWGRIEWNDSGKQLMADKAYRGVSPVFTAIDKTGEVLRVLRASLTNSPNLGDLHTLHHQETGVLDIAKIRAALGLPETADEAAILASATALHAGASLHATQMKAIAAAAGAAETITAAGLVTHLNTVRATGGEVQTMAAKVVSLETELNTMKAGNATRAATVFVDGAIKDGKPIASLRDHYIARHAADPVAVEKEIGALVSINAGGMGGKPRMNSGDGDELSDEEMAVCKKMSMDPKKFAEHRNKMNKKGAA